MAEAGGDADCAGALEELRVQLADDLHAFMAEHQEALQRQFGEWMAGHNDRLEECIRQFAEKDAGLKAQALDPVRRADAERGAQTSPPPRRNQSSVGSTPSDQSIHRTRSYREYQDSKKRQAMLSSQERQDSKRRPARSSTAIIYASYHTGMRDRARTLVQSKTWNYFVSIIILAHITAMGFEVEMDPPSAEVPVMVQMGCNIVFIVELLLRICAQGVAFLTGTERLWNLLDSGLVLASVLEMSLEGVTSSDLGSTFDNVMTLRVVRVVRIIRVVRVVRVLRFFRPLRMLVHSIIATLRSLGYVIMLLGIIIYSCALVFTEAAKQHHAWPDPARRSQYFGSLARSMLTLFKAVTNGTSWESVYQPLSDAHWFYGCVFIAYIIFATFAVLNVMTAQFCQYAMESARQDDEEVICEQLANKQYYVEKLRALFQSLAGDDEVECTLQTFERNINEERVSALFQSLDIKISDAWTLFRLLDEKNDHLIDMNEFVEGCLQLKGPATAIDLRVLANEIHWFDKRLEKKLVQLATCQVDIMKRLHHDQESGQGAAAETPASEVDWPDEHPGESRRLWDL